MLELALHLLDIAENSTRAGAKTVDISLREDDLKNRLSMVISDDGQGMDKETLEKALDPFYTTKKVRRVGLGLPMLAQAAEKTGGKLILESTLGKGTRTAVTFGLSHIDRQPLGDVAGALVALIAGNPETRFIYAHEHNDQVYRLDTDDLKNELGDVPLNHVEVLKFIRDHIKEGLKEINSEA
jgi:signal transduction histidine kinase